MTQRSPSRKAILRRAAAYAARRARPARPDPLANVRPLIALSREMRDRPGVWDLSAVAWDAPTRSTPLEDMRAVQDAVLSHILVADIVPDLTSSGVGKLAALGTSPLRPAYRIWGLYKAFPELL